MAQLLLAVFEVALQDHMNDSKSQGSARFLLVFIALSLLLFWILSPLAERRGQDSCWVRLRHSKETGSEFKLGEWNCFTRRAWRSWLRDGESSALPENEIRPERERFFSPLMNDREVSRSQPSIPKPVGRIWKYDRVPPELGGFELSFRRRIEAWRERVGSALEPWDSSGVLRQLLLNEKSGEDSSLWIRLGFVHVLNATGIHLVAWAALLETIILLACKFLFPLFPIHRALMGARALAGLSFWGIAALAGFRAGIFRPLFLILLRWAAQDAGAKWKDSFPKMPLIFLFLGEVGIRRVAGNSSTAEWSGMKTYLLAVVGGGAGWRAAQKFPPHGRHFFGHLFMALGSWLPLLGFEIYEHGGISILTPFLSLTTLPLVAWVIFPCLLIGAVFSGAAFEVAGFWANRGLLPLHQWEMKSTGAIWLIPPWAGLLGCVLILVLTSLGRAFSRKGKWAAKFRGAVLAMTGLLLFGRMLLPLSLPPLVLDPWKAIRIEQLDVGQGDAALVTGEGFRRDGRVFLVDTGSAHALKASGWLELLMRRGIGRIDGVVLTHLDEDHAGGLKNLMKVVPITCVVTGARHWQTPGGRALREELSQLKIRVESWEGTQNCVPFSGWSGKWKEKSRNTGMTAVVIPLNSPGGGVYVNAGDSDSEQERAFLKKIRVYGKLRILKVSHHGSRSSSDPLWIRKIFSGSEKSEAWISAGVGNSYGHPARETLERFRTITVRRTDRNGLILWEAGQIRSLPPSTTKTSPVIQEAS